MSPEDLLWRPKRCMCLVWALVMYGRFVRAYGDLASVGIQCQESKHLHWPLNAIIPHFHVTLKLPDRYEVWGYDPMDTSLKWVPPPWFKGQPVRDNS